MIDWEQVRIDAAISAMQGVLESGKLGMVLEASPDTVAKQAVRLADALVEKLKGEKYGKDNGTLGTSLKCVCYGERHRQDRKHPL